MERQHQQIKSVAQSLGFTEDEMEKALSEAKNSSETKEPIEGVVSSEDPQSKKVN